MQYYGVLILATMNNNWQNAKAPNVRGKLKSQKCVKVKKSKTSIGACDVQIEIFTKNGAFAA